jgi:hypothetical protein
MPLRERLARLGDVFAVAVALSVAVAYGFHALVLVRYPWDWAPDEGLYLDCARRLVLHPSTVYGKSLVPYPCFYTPLLFAVIAPAIHASQPLAWARMAAVSWTALSASAVFALVYRRSVPLAAATVALAFAPFDLSFWHLLIRMDGLMIALWLLAGLALLPREVVRGADRLGPIRETVGILALVAAFLAKQTALLHMAPLVLCWFFVDTRAARRLSLIVAASLASTVVGLEVASQGGFSYANRWWGSHPIVWPHVAMHGWNFAVRAWPVLAFCVAGGVVAQRQGARPWREAALWLCLGGVMAAPAMAKVGALWTYVLPLLPAAAVLGGRWWAAGGPRSAHWGALVAAALAAWMAATREFPLPDGTDRLSAQAFYAFIRESAAVRPGPILAVRPEYAYFVAGQPVEMEGTSFGVLAARQAPGMERVLGRLRGAEYRLVISNPDFFPSAGPYAEALASRYRIAGGCILVFIDGPSAYTFLVPKDSPLGFQPPAGTRCWR